jgi:hypothetical protein
LMNNAADARATKAKSKVYSTKSWPCSSLKKFLLRTQTYPPGPSGTGVENRRFNGTRALWALQAPRVRPRGTKFKKILLRTSARLLAHCHPASFATLAQKTLRFEDLKF